MEEKKSQNPFGSPSLLQYLICKLILNSFNIKHIKQLFFSFQGLKWGE